MSSANSFSPATFEIVRRLLQERSGIVLGADKQYLVQLRLGPLAKAAGCSSIDQYIAGAPASAVSSMQTAIVEAMTTNETSFFRDVSPFDALRQTILPEILKNRGGQGRIRIWCGACSTGQEPYSVAMVIREHFPQLRADIVATDLAKSVITIARAGRYSQLEVNRGLPAAMLIKYFEQQGNEWALGEDIKRMVDFRQMNLITPWPAMQHFDLVFLRNVMIYFNLETKRTILQRLRQVMRPDGYLFLGAAETTMGIEESFQRQAVGRSSCYRVAAGKGAPLTTAPRPAGSIPGLSQFQAA